MRSRGLVIGLMLLLSLSSFALVLDPSTVPSPISPHNDRNTPNAEVPANDINQLQMRDHSAWWQGWQGDQDVNGLDDRLDRALSEPHSGDGTVPIFIIYDHLPTDEEVEAAEEMVQVDYRAHHVELLTVYEAPLHLIPELLELPGVVQIQQQNEMVPFMDVSARSVKARPSNEYRDQDVWETLGYDGSGVNVAVLDTGVDDEHEALQGKFVAGYDATALLGDPNNGNGQTNPDDGEGHGTHVAGTVMSNPPDTQIMGVAPGSGLIDVKVMTEAGVSNSGYTQDGIEWCIDHKDDFDIRVLSMSFGSASGDDDGKSAEAETVNRAVEAGLVAVVAVGNDGERRIPSPASADLAITVAASDDVDTVKRNDDIIASYSNYGPRQDDGDNDDLDELKPEITAPGTDITSTCAFAPGSLLGCSQNNDYTTMSGTSMATPHISGVAALMLEAAPQLTPKQLKKAMTIAAERRGNATSSHISADYNDHWGWGLVDSYRGVQASLGGVVEITIETPQDDDVLSGRIAVQGTASAGSGLERITFEIAGQEYETTAEESWTWTWDTRKFNNGNWRLTATATSTNNLTAKDIIEISIHNVAEPKKKEEGLKQRFTDLMDQLGDRVTGNPDRGPLVAVGLVVVIVALAVGTKVALGRRDQWDEW